MSSMFCGCQSLSTLDLSSFDTSKVRGMEEMFCGCQSLRALALSSFDTSKVTSMNSMFSGCASLTSLALSRFDTSEVTSMKSMFSGCASLTALDFSRFDTSEVTDMSRMFCGCQSLATLDLSSFDTSRVTDMSLIFSDCASLTSLALSGFYTSMVRDMSGMFKDCKSLTTLNLSSFDTSRETDMSHMFSGCASLTTIWNNSTWNCNKSRDMFAGCVSLKGEVAYDKVQIGVSLANPTGYFTPVLQAYVHLSTDETTLTFYYDTLRVDRNGTTWRIRGTEVCSPIFCPAWAGGCGFPNTTILTAVFDVSFRDFRPTTTQGWFYFLESLKSIEGLEYLNTSQVMGMRRMFYGCASLTALDLSNFDTSQVTDMSDMFSHCGSLTSLDLSSFDTSQVTDMSHMFSGCGSLTSLDLSSFDTSQVMDMSHMFSGCGSLTSLDLSSFNTSQVTSMFTMFYGCASLTALDLSNFDTSKVTYMGQMFSGCGSLTALDLSNFDASQVMSVTSMFSHCQSLTTIYCNSSWRAVDYSDYMFSGCNSLRAAAPNVRKGYGVSMANPETGYFTKNVLSQEDEAYVHLSSDKKTLTFYFDRERNVRMRCCAWDIETTIRQNHQMTPAWLSSEVVSKDEITQIVIDESFRNVVPKTTASWFEGLSAVTEIRGLDNLNTSEVTDMSRMFAGCSALHSLDVSSFDTSQVTDMSSMFSGCESLTTIYCNSSWSASQSDDMFSGCHSLRAATSNVGNSCDVSMANPETGYFTKKVLSQEDEAYVHLSSDKKTLTFYFDRERNVRMRCCAWDIETTIRQNHQMTPAWLSSEVVSKDEITQIVIDESFRNVVPKPTASWFEGLSAVKEIRGLDNLNTSEVTDMSRMFAGCSALRSLEVSRFDTSKVTDMSSMFSGCESLAELDLYFFDTSKVTDMHAMFSGCATLSALNLAHFDTAKVTNMGEMFADCSALVDLDISRFDTAKVKDMRAMFSGCATLSALNLAHFDTAKVTDMHAMFKDCKSLTTLDLSNFQTSEVKNMSDMFSGCSALTTILSFAFRNCFASDAMFYECTSLQGAVSFNENCTDARMANPERGYFSKR